MITLWEWQSIGLEMYIADCKLPFSLLWRSSKIFWKKQKIRKKNNSDPTHTPDESVTPFKFARFFKAGEKKQQTSDKGLQY